MQPGKKTECDCDDHTNNKQDECEKPLLFNFSHKLILHDESAWLEWIAFSYVRKDVLIDLLANSWALLSLLHKDAKS